MKEGVNERELSASRHSSRVVQVLPDQRSLAVPDTSDVAVSQVERLGSGAELDTSDRLLDVTPANVNAVALDRRSSPWNASDESSWGQFH